MSDELQELKEQFLIEGRDLLETAGECLLQLEQRPDDGALVAALFRAVHTLKGNSGLFPVVPLTRVVHAAEDLLDEVRAGKLALDSAMADVLLDALDQVSGWLDAFDLADHLPEGADTVAGDLAARLSVFRVGSAEETPAAQTRALARDWLDDLSPADRHSALAALQADGPVVLVDYIPDGDCFFRGEDPLRFMLTLPGKIWLAVTPIKPLTPGPEFDPYTSSLRFRAISTASRAEVDAHLAYVAEQVALATQAPPEDTNLRGLLEGLAESLAAPGPAELLASRLASAATVLTRLLPGQDVDAARDASLSEGDPAPLLAMIARALAPEAAGPKPEPEPEPEPEPSKSPRRASVLKVDQARIDMLMKLAGELIVAKNGLPFLAQRAEETYGSRALAREIRAQFEVFNRIVAELQSTVMQVRMVPLATVFDRYRRLVRDLSRQVGKPLDFIVEGAETEADKNIVEELAEPLVHLIRNAVDHGLETPDERAATGKPAEGLVRLSARLVGDKVVIELSDDGRGIDVARVRAKAVERGLVQASEAEAMPDEVAMRLILRPGFSTADTISSLSGRGVGMDVVATMVERSGGTLTLRSKPGQGTTVAITLPLSMTVRRMMMVGLEGSQYGVPLEMVLETARIPQSELHRHLGPPQILRRDRLIPLCDLRKPLALPPRASDPAELSVLIVAAQGGEVGLIVDAFHASTEVIPQPLEGPLAGLSCFSGAALLGDGSILMILDVEEVLQCPW